MTGRKRLSSLVALSVLCAAFAAFPNSVFAEPAVGLEAQGVDPWAALRNPHGLEIRDTQGQLVSADIIRRQLVRARAKSQSQAALVSRLPKARVLFNLIDLVSTLGGFWRNPLGPPASREVWALPLRLRLDQGAASLPVCLGLVVLTAALGCCRVQFASSCSLQKSVALRC